MNHVFQASRISTLVIVFLGSLPTCMGQQVDTTPKAPISRDPSSIKTLSLAIEAMGGTGAWEQFHGATTTGTYTISSINQNVSFVWSDDWRGEALIKRDNVLSNGKHSLYIQPSSTASSTSNTSPNATNPLPRRPKIDNVAALIGHLPGAALQLALQQTDYSISSIASSKLASTDDVCVAITRGSVVRADSIKKVAICFSRSTHLPTTAYVVLPNLYHPVNKIIEEIHFIAFQQSGNVLIPKHITTSQSNRNVKEITIAAVSWNPAFDANTFNDGAK